MIYPIDAKYENYQGIKCFFILEQDIPDHILVRTEKFARNFARKKKGDSNETRPEYRIYEHAKYGKIKEISFYIIKNLEIVNEDIFSHNGADKYDVFYEGKYIDVTTANICSFEIENQRHKIIFSISTAKVNSIKNRYLNEQDDNFIDHICLMKQEGGKIYLFGICSIKDLIEQIKEPQAGSYNFIFYKSLNKEDDCLTKE